MNGKFLTLCNKFSATHDFFSTDPANTLAQLNLNPADFTDPSIDDQPLESLSQRAEDPADLANDCHYVGAVVMRDMRPTRR